MAFQEDGTGEDTEIFHFPLVIAILSYRADMFRWRRVLPLSLRLFRMHSMSSDPLLDQLITCTNQFQIFQLVGIHKSKLTVQHVGCAINTLWEIQKERPSSGLNLESVRHHPEFIALRILAENKIDFMNDTTLVDTLYAVIR